MKTSFKYGAVAGVLCASLFYAEYFSGISSRSAGLFSLAGMAVIVALALFFYLRKIASPGLNGFYTYGYGIKKGMAVVASCAVVMGIFTFVFFRFINPEYIDALVERGMAEMRGRGITEEQIQLQAAHFKNSHSPFLETMRSMLRILLVGGIFSPLFAVLVKRFR